VHKFHYFGTCRVHAPLAHLAKNNKIELLENNWSFLHTTKEILQAINLVKGNKSIPKELETVAGFPKGVYDIDLNEADFFVVEVSSLKSFMLNSTFMQLNRLREKTVVPFPELNDWFKKLEKAGESKHIGGVGDPDIDYFIDNSRCKKLHASEIHADLSGIFDLLGKPVILVSSFNYPDRFTGEFLIPRLELIKILGDFNHSNLLKFIDPSVPLESEGYHESTKDSAHYKDSMVPKVSQHIWRELNDVRGFIDV
jgi:hypothetical protein